VERDAPNAAYAKIVASLTQSIAGFATTSIVEDDELEHVNEPPVLAVGHGESLADKASGSVESLIVNPATFAPGCVDTKTWNCAALGEGVTDSKKTHVTEELPLDVADGRGDRDGANVDILTPGVCVPSNDLVQLNELV
jgi:hypothetical protein